MKRIEEEYGNRICPYCHNDNLEDCNIRVFNCDNHICCKCVNYNGELKKTEIIKQGDVDDR